MNKMFSFLAGGICGALIGSITALLLTPASGAQLKADAEARWHAAIQDGRQAMTQTERTLEMQFEQATRGR